MAAQRCPRSEKAGLDGQQEDFLLRGRAQGWRSAWLQALRSQSVRERQIIIIITVNNADATCTHIGIIWTAVSPGAVIGRGDSSFSRLVGSDGGGVVRSGVSLLEGVGLGGGVGTGVGTSGTGLSWNRTSSRYQFMVRTHRQTED